MKRMKTLAAVLGASLLLSAPQAFAEEAAEPAAAQESTQTAPRTGDQPAADPENAPSEAQAAEAKDTAAAAETAEQQKADEEVLKKELEVAGEPYTYKSEKYGYTITLPKKPIAVIGAGQLDKGRYGDVFIFANKEYDILYGWVVYYNDFAETSVPDFNKMDAATEKAYLEKLKTSFPYETVGMGKLSKKNKAVFAITALSADIDTDGDGEPDATATAPFQNAEIIFRGNKGGRFRLELIDKPTLRPQALAEFTKGAESFVEN